MPGIVEKWGGVIVTRHAGLRIENGSCAEKEDGGAMLWRNEKDMEVSSEQAEGSKPGNIKAKKCEKTWMVSSPSIPAQRSSGSSPGRGAERF